MPIIITLLMGLGFFIAAPLTDDDQQVWADNYISARKSAIELNRPYFIFFRQDQCAPCEKVLQGFATPSIESIIRQSYVGVQVDINDFDGHTLKKYYNVEYLPTLIIFSSKGEVLQRYNQALSPTQLQNALIRPKLSVFPTKSKGVTTELIEDAQKVKKSFLQTGAFSDKTEAENFKHRMSRILDRPAILHEENTTLKVLIGPFDNKSEIIKTQDQLKAYGYKSHVVHKSNTSNL